MFPYVIAGFFGAIIGGLIVAAVILGFMLDEDGTPFWSSRDTEEMNEQYEQIAIDLERPEFERGIINVVKAATPSVVMITTIEHREVPYVFGRLTRQVSGLGSGVIFNDEGHILTNSHVVARATEIAVVLPDGREFVGDQVRLIGRDDLTDLAVLQIQGEDLPVARIGDSRGVEVGQYAIAIGNPYGLDHTVTSGIISALERPVPVDPQGGIVLEDLIQTDTPINPGNSGGPLLNLQGEVVGINTAIIQEAQSIGFAIPINIALNIAGTLIEHGRVIRPWLGVDVITITQGLVNELDLPVDEGVGVAYVAPGSPADRGGLQAGDIIIEINQEPVSIAEELQQTFSEMDIGTRVLLTIIRVQDELIVPVTVGERPQEW